MSTEKDDYVCNYYSGDVNTHTVGMNHFDFSEKITFNFFEDLAHLQGAEEEIIDQHLDVMHKWLQFYFSLSLKSFKFF